MLSKEELQAILTHFMVYDNHWENEELTRKALNKLSQDYGYTDWIEAYHG